LVRRHGIRGIKDTTCTLEGITAKIEAAPESIVYQANTPFMLDAVHRGAGGLMAVTSTAAADILTDLWRKGASRDPEAEIVLEKLLALNAVLGTNYPSAAKYLASLRGVKMHPRTRTGRALRPADAKAVEILHRSLLRNGLTYAKEG